MGSVLIQRAGRLLVVAALLGELGLLSFWVRGEITRSGNESSRLATVQSLVERGTFTIDGSPIETVDRVRIGGRFYSNKPLLLSLWLAGLYAPLHLFAGLDFEGAYPLLVYALTLIGITSFSVLLTYLFQRRLRARGLGLLPALGLGLAVVWTTWIWSYGISINNHTPAAALLFALLWLLEGSEEAPSPRRTALAGMLAGLLMGVEIPAGGTFFLVGLAVLAPGQRLLGRRPLGAYLGGFGAVTLALAAVNFAVYGYPLDAYLIPGAFAFAGSIHPPRAGGLLQPDYVPSYLFHITFGLRGFFSHMPALLLAFPYLWWGHRDLSATDRWTLLGAAVLILFYGTQAGIYGGWAYGFRFLIPLTPAFFWWASLWLVGRPPAAGSTDARSSAGHGAQRLILGAPLLAVGLLTSWVGAQNPWPVAFEGAATAPSAVEYRVRSPFLAGLLVCSYEHDPEGPLFRFLADSVYGRPTASRYLYKELLNRGEVEELPELGRRISQWRRRYQTEERP